MLRKKVKRYIEEHGLMGAGETICVGLSGGADSVCLLLILKDLAEELDCKVEAVHVNHRLRGMESDGDQAFVEELCSVQGIPLHLFSFPVEDMAKELQLGIEEAGRAARQKAFDSCIKEHGAHRIALAHHRRDQAETVLFRLARGSSIRGLGGIRPFGDRIIHPFLFADKEEILEELNKRGQSWCNDSSNFSDQYTRNCIRQQLIPVLEERVNSGSVEHICQLAEDLCEVEEFLDSLTEPLRQRCVTKRNETQLLVRSELLQEPLLLQKRVLLDTLAALGESRKDLGRRQVASLLDLLKGETGRKASLPGRIQAIKSYKGLILQKNPGKLETDEKTDTAPLRETLDQGSGGENEGSVGITGEGIFRFGRWKITCEILNNIPEEIPEKPYTKWLDYAKIKDSLEIRNRRPGDFLVITPDGGRKKLKSYFIDEKIPAEERADVPLLASGSSIFWVIGHRISEDCKITAQTEQCIKIEITEEET